VRSKTRAAGNLGHGGALGCEVRAEELRARMSAQILRISVFRGRVRVASAVCGASLKNCEPERVLRFSGFQFSGEQARVRAGPTRGPAGPKFGRWAPHFPALGRVIPGPAASRLGQI
jgi:hypothetical protein